MNDLFCFLDGFGSGGPLNKSILIVSVPAGSTVTATLGPQIKTAQERNGEAWLRNLDVGEWNLKLTLGDQTATTKYNITEFGVYRISMSFEITLYLYNNGDENAGITGGWTSKALEFSAGGTPAAPTITREPNKLVISLNPTYKSGIAYPTKKVDLTDYKTLEIIANDVVVPENGICSLCIWTNLGSNIETNCISRTDLTNTSLSKTVDISKISGKNVVGIALGSGSSNKCIIELKTCVLRG